MPMNSRFALNFVNIFCLQEPYKVDWVYKFFMSYYSKKARHNIEKGKIICPSLIKVDLY